MSRTIRTFKEWLIHGEPEVLTKSKIYIEDLSGNKKIIKIKELQKLLKDYDFYYSMSDDYRAYKRGKEQQDKILKLVREIGKDGDRIWKDYIKRNESKETGTEKYMSNLFPEMRNVQPQGNRIPVGERGTSYLSDGDLFSGFQFFPRTPKPLSIEEKHQKRTMIYGKVYNGE